MSKAGAVTYLHADHLGSTSVASDEAGDPVGDALRYYPYGTERTGSPGTMPTDYLFTGQRREATTGGLYHMGARFYDPYINRFVSPDSIIPQPGNPQSLNRFTYCLNNPLRYTDPSGHTVRSALDQIREHGEDIVSIAMEFGIDPLLLAGVVFAENRNDLNWIRGQDWSSHSPWVFLGDLR